MGAWDGTGEQRHWALTAARAVAVAWGLSGVGSLALPGAYNVGVVLVPLAIGLFYRPSLLRWPLLAFVVLAPIGFLALAHGYFHARTSYPLVIWALVGIASHVLLLFGSITRVRLVLGATAFLAYLVGARFVMTASLPAPEVCQTRVDALSRRLNALLTTPQWNFQPQAAQLPEMRGRARAAGPHPIFEVTATASWLGKQQPEDIAQAAAQLRSFVEYKRARASDSTQLPLYLAADGATPVSKIGALFSQVRNLRVFLLGKSEAGPLGPPPASAIALAAALDRAATVGELARLSANELGQRAGPCAPLAKRLVKLNDMPPESRSVFLVTSLDQGLRECQCGLVDIDALEYLSLRILGAPSHGFAEVAIPNDESGNLAVPNEPDLTVTKWLERL